MTSLEKMIYDIESEASVQSQEIIENAHKKATEILEKTREKAYEKATDILKNADVIIEKLLKKNRSAEDLEKRKVILSAKQDAINSIISDAKTYLLGLPTKKYFEVMLWLLDRVLCENSEYMIALSMHDRKRVTEEFVVQMDLLAEGRCSKVLFDLNPANIMGGFILKNGGVEQNYSIEALFEQYNDELCDMLKEFLFSDEGK